ncbi:MAG TPA: transmembrane glycosyltransferase [Sphingobacteriaceae bacterium]|nr:transmembrane glycosyltransferase [Sphingobacteriaceae bacterium]
MNYLYFLILALFLSSFLVQLYYILAVHLRLRSFKPDEPDESVQHPVSVIICARNEENNLKENLTSILEQNYPDFEVIVVNDCSNDDTKYVLDDFAKRYPHLKIVNIAEHERFKHGKKFAVTLGIKAAQNEHLVFTDADCQPASENWLRRMQQHFTGGNEIVLGYSPYQRIGGLLNMLIRFETFYTALNYFSFALTGRPYMGVGRNLSYTRSLFFRGKGFASHMHILSGDDDLFVNQHANNDNTVIEIHADSHVWTEPKRTLSSFFTQKLRHMGAGKAYRSSHKQMLFLQAGSAIAFYIFLIALIAFQAPWWILVSVFMVRTFVQLIVYYPIFNKLSYPDLIWWFPVMDFIYYFYLLSLNTIALFKKKARWR